MSLFSEDSRSPAKGRGTSLEMLSATVGGFPGMDDSLGLLVPECRGSVPKSLQPPGKWQGMLFGAWLVDSRGREGGDVESPG